jgi:hypothetical protein
VNTLERRYRRLVGLLLPEPYRQAWEDDMVATFLDRMSTGDPEVDEYLEEFGRPDADEVLSVVALAIRLRLAGPDGEPRAALWGQAVRTFALTCLLANALLLPLGVAQEAWISSGLWLPAEINPLGIAHDHSAWEQVTHWVTLIGWPVAFLAVLFGRRSVALLASAAAVLPSLVAALVLVAQMLLDRQPSQGTATFWSMLIFQSVVIVALAAFHQTAPGPDPAPWVRRLAIGAAVVPAVGICILLQSPAAMLVTPVSLAAVSWLVATFVLPRTTLNVLTLVLLAPVVIVLCGSWLVDAALPSDRPVLDAWTACALTLASAARALTLWRTSRRLLADEATPDEIG